MVFSRRPRRSSSASTRPAFQSTHEIDAQYAWIICRASASLASRLMNRSPLGVKQRAGNPSGTVGRGAKVGGRGIAAGSYLAKNDRGAVGGLCGLLKPQARKNGR